jgi:hypothetical protein
VPLFVEGLRELPAEYPAVLEGEESVTTPAANSGARPLIVPR